ncbi:phosphoadenosine phosphosulfate reductase family protein [Paenibacillus sp. NRS-1760]|uniref:phosphoadenosine phosphosulfate reductase family protein n=1 Tax=Paenibacillus sp. NRS-1760 TaxID=3233902 RepID=UPI003D294276
MEQIANVMSVSGGKDSAAMWIYATKELGVEVIPVFADTGNEHPSTYEYLDYLERELGPIRRVVPDFTKQIAKKREYVQEHWAGKGVTDEQIKIALEHLKPSGNPFLDLCIWKGRFPSTKVRFCTQFLKIIPIAEGVYFPLLEDGYHIISWQGVRAAESPARAKLPMREDTPEGYEVYRPLLNWSAKDVFDMHKKHGIEPNPLYSQGMSRVGCMPCINVNKGELFQISRRFPKEIERIAEWEQIVAKASKRGDSSFLPALLDDDKKDIWDWVEWSKTSYGGHTYDLLKMIELDDFPSCSSVYGLCE